MLDRLPLELVEQIVFDASPWTTAERFAFLSAVSKRYQEIFRPYARRYVVGNSQRLYHVVEGGSIDEDDVPLLGLLPSVETVVLNHAGGLEDLVQDDGDDDPDPYVVPVVVSGNSPFQPCRTLVIKNSDTWWTLEQSLGSQPFALEHLTVQIGSRTRVEEPWDLWQLVDAGVFPELKTLNLEVSDPPEISLSVLDKLDYIQAVFNSGLPEIWHIPSGFRLTTTPILYTVVRTSLGIGELRTEGIQYVYLEHYWDETLGDLGPYLEAFADLRAVFIMTMTCTCNRSTPYRWQNVASTCAGRPSDEYAPIEPDFIDYLKRNPHSPPPRRDSPPAASLAP
ncbi:hypothetical protein BMF94_3286 [Rhodotorula taiwanensis]|uniref:F-box domain-containing protein n=1 Tax=Rhodotorula taiwanensis TaxID=741276 RepID=A0A2S5BAF4_9BASI|nr:hypothetical protein BMF94_3286 [Rhodotorula taiwanensis]